MIKVEVIEKFTLKKFEDLKKLKRAKKEHEDSKYDGTLFINDEFECSEEMAKYLTGDNTFNKTVVKILEVNPKIKLSATSEEIVVETPVEIVEEKKSKKKKTSKK